MWLGPARPGWRSPVSSKQNCQFEKNVFQVWRFQFYVWNPDFGLLFCLFVLWWVCFVLFLRCLSQLSIISLDGKWHYMKFHLFLNLPVCSPPKSTFFHYPPPPTFLMVPSDCVHSAGKITGSVSPLGFTQSLPTSQVCPRPYLCIILYYLKPGICPSYFIMASQPTRNTPYPDLPWSLMFHSSNSLLNFCTLLNLYAESPKPGQIL